MFIKRNFIGQSLLNPIEKSYKLMKIQHNKALAAIRRVLFFGTVITSVVINQYSYAKNKSITGTHLNIDNNPALIIIEREQLLSTGITNVGELLQRLPVFNGSPINSRTNLNGNGDVRIDLRGLGSGRTLVLVDGQRTVDNGDFQSIPSVMIQRVEILPQSASAIYGANAVAGVVNIITRKGFSGTEIEATYSDSFETDNLEKKQASFIFGHNIDQGNLTIGFQHEDQQGALRSDTPYAFLQNSYFISDAQAYQNGGFNVNADYLLAIGSSRIPCGVFNLASGGPALTINGNSPATGDCGTPGALLTPDNFRPYIGSFSDPDNDSYNYAPFSLIQTPYEKTNIFVNANHEFNHVRLFANIRYNDRTSSQKQAPLPFDSINNPAAPLMFGGNGISAENVYNPFAEEIVRVRRRMTELERRNNQDVQQYQAVIGINGDFANNTWQWQASYNYGMRTIKDTTIDRLLGPRLLNALGPSYFDENGVAVCGTPELTIAGCVPLNLFGGPGTITTDMINYISADLTDTTTDKLNVFNAHISGSLLESQAGSVDAHFGLEYRKQETDFLANEFRRNSLILFNDFQVPSGDYEVSSFYSGIHVPLINHETMGQLFFDVNGRHDKHSIVGSPNSLQASLTYQPTTSFLINAGYSEAFQEPTTVQLYTQRYSTFLLDFDPCLIGSGFNSLTPEQQAVCLAQGVPNDPGVIIDPIFPLTRGGNQDLNHTTAKNTFLGADWRPEFLPGFNLGLNWWQFDIDDGITENTANDIIFNCLNSGDANSHQCSRVVRNTNGLISFIDGTFDNTVQQKISGIDVNLNYTFQNEWGEFDLGVHYSTILEYESQQNSITETNELTGQFSNEQVYIEDKVQIIAQWHRGDWQINYQLQYLSGIEAPIQFSSTPGNQKIGSQVYNDISVAYQTPINDATITFGINNFLDKDPVFIDAASNLNHTQASTYRVFGRTWFMRWNMAF